jgi:hypothetical protein
VLASPNVRGDPIGIRYWGGIQGVHTTTLGLFTLAKSPGRGALIHLTEPIQFPSEVRVGRVKAIFRARVVQKPMLVPAGQREVTSLGNKPQGSLRTERQEGVGCDMHAKGILKGPCQPVMIKPQ